ncbi:MAG TPA: M23 family metallopeptidase [Acidobacteriaceae bacterium]|nr:M23 family metallopeptidase [Acidobacteriaceae bacterium]
MVSSLTRTTEPVLATDGKYHVVYELVVMNSRPTPATLKKIEVLDAGKPASDPSAVLATYEHDALLSRLRTLASAPASSPELEFNGTRLFLVDLTFDTRAQVPGRLLHRFAVMGAPSPAPMPVTPVALSYTVAPLDLHQQLLEIGPPLAGKRWVVFNGCCELAGAHRGSGLPVNGGIYFAQRFAIDWLQLDESGRLVHGDPADVHSYADYDADVLAVADGTVVAMLDTLDDQPPGKLPDVNTMTLANVDGNHVVQDLGGGVYAFYAHMRKKSILVAVGQHVKRGQVLGKLGNTGNTSAPHLHFHLMDGPSVLGSNGIPYVIDSFALAGKVPETADTLEGSWSAGLFPNASPRHDQFPLDLDVVDFK